eukprot:GILI01032667.1.p1 GENE.GILI01032667.1~~GILI01032667.1.p1  ORF type:complete len:271 (-),score=-12.65 GILI01032667.1:30-842(-)
MSSVCACKGIRKCASCGTPDASSVIPSSALRCLYCHRCQRVVDEKKFRFEESCAHSEDSIISTDPPFHGLLFFPDFVTEEEEFELLHNIDLSPWKDSQSGRRKQDFGPQVNFKHRKIKMSTFTGLPAYSRFVVERFASSPGLEDFDVIEQGNLEYHSDRGAAVDPHFDDSWLWGRRIVGLSLCSDSFMTFLDLNGRYAIRVPIPRRSLYVMDGSSRNNWLHAICREDVNGRRVCMTFRELAAEFLPGGAQESVGEALRTTAHSFEGVYKL